MQQSSSFLIYNASAGSGKTFTLVKEYLKILLKSENIYKFQNVLAVTFTNKAAGEMKERVIENLHNFSKEESTDMLHIICEECALDPATVFKRSSAVLNAILQNYSAFNITTIDSFTYKLIKSFAYDLNLPLSFDVEMDVENLLNEAVDLVISKIGEDQKLTDLLIEYSLQKMDSDKSWDISNELKSFAKLILNENHVEQFKKLNAISIEDFKLLKSQLKKEALEIEKNFSEIGNQGLNLISEQGIEIKDFSYSGELPKHFKKLTALKYLKPEELKFEGRLNKTIEEKKNLYAAKCDAATKQQIDAIAEELRSIYDASRNFYNEVFAKYVLNNLIADSLIPLAVLNHINLALKELKEENNILLNAEFNRIISDTIKNEPAPFIYERIGEKFQYYFIDEMQDTSVMQWQNLIPLIGNAIASESISGEKGKLMLVGDAKQSIYRWRGGKAEQFISLSNIDDGEGSNPFHLEKTLENLDTNYRSFSEIIKFNNSFFQHSSQYLSNKSFAKLFFEGNDQNLNKNKGGYVQLSFVERNREDDEFELVYPKKVFEIINDLDESFQKSDVCVLVRTRKQGVEVANYLSEKGIDIISSETLLIKNSEKVGFIINLLAALQNPNNKEYRIKILYYLYKHLKIESDKHEFFNNLIHLDNKDFYKKLKEFGVNFEVDEFKQNPFYESIEYSIRSFNLVNQSDAYIQFFLDVVFDYQQKKQASIPDFLEYWDLKKENLSIVAPEAKSAIRIMTIHKSKGLEFPVVIHPFDLEIYRQINPKVWYEFEESNNINSALINYSNRLNYIGKKGEELFHQRREELELDNFNLLYVTLTRAKEQLYIITNKPNSRKQQEIKYTSQLFSSYLNANEMWDEDTLEYSFGSKERVLLSEEDFISNSVTQERFISSAWKEHNISIVANSSLNWDTVQGAAVGYGNLVHELLSKIRTKNDITEILDAYLYTGVLSKTGRKELKIKLLQIVTHPELAIYFDHNLEVYNEQEIVTNEKQILIPDRLVVENKKVTILDYKTGMPNEDHHSQIKNYTNVLENLGYSVVKKLLVYINEEIMVEEV